MKKINKFLIYLVSLIIVILISCSICVALFGKKIVVTQIEKNLKVKASLESMSFSLPFSVKLTGLEIGNLIKVEKISANPSILGFLFGKVVLNNLTMVNPVIYLEQAKDGSFNLPVLEQKGEQPPILLAGLSIKNGKLAFSDKKVADDYKIMLEKINVDIAKVKLPLTSLNTKFSISASFVNREAKAIGAIGFKGWIDFVPKDMDAVLEILGLDITYFAPYYGEFISNKKLLSAKLDFTSLIKAENNDLSIGSKFKLSNLVYEKEQPPKEGEASSVDFTKNALDFFADEKGNISFEFTINTKLDNPKLDEKELKRVMLEAAMRNLSRQSPQAIIDKVSGNIEQFKEIGKQLKDIFKKKGE